MVASKQSSSTVGLLTVLAHLLFLTTVVVDAATPVIEIVEGTDNRCPNNAPNDIKTYVFSSSGLQRCFNVYEPPSANESSPSPVLIMAHGMGSNAGLWCKKPDVRAQFAALGITLLCTASANWEGDPNNPPDKPTRWRPPVNGSTASNPYPCTEQDSIDVAYFESILDWIDSRPSQFDRERVFNGGFSQGSNFASYISFCFADRLRGVALAGSGLKVNGPAVDYCSDYDTNQQGGFCEIGVFDGWRNTGNVGTCDECRFYPIMPVSGATDVVGDPLKVCINIGENDSRVQGSDQYRYYYDQAGLRTDFVIYEGLGHSLPEGWPAIHDECLGITDTASPPPPPPPPTLQPTIGDPPTTCVDDAEWRFRDNPNRSCNWVATRQNVLRNCNKRANNPISDKTKVRIYCKATCDAAGDDKACSEESTQ